MQTYDELRVRIERGEQGRYRVFASGPSGEATSDFALPFAPLEIENFILKVSGVRARTRSAASSQTRMVTEFGGKLFDALFQSRLRDLYRDSSSMARTEGRGLRITLSLTSVPELMHLPWECLYDSPNFLSISTYTPVVRYLDLPRGRKPLPVQLPLRILAMVSSPTDAVQLDVEHERSNLEAALRTLTEHGSLQITWLETATLRALQYALRAGEYHVFHYIGHGAYDEQVEDGVLLLEDDAERGRAVTGVELGTMLYDHTTLRLAVLNACEGARTSSDDPFAGVASSLIQREIPAVIAMQFEITDRAAIVFAEGFYSAIADGYAVDSALAEARKAIYAEGNEVEWATPVLFMRVPDGRIFDLPKREHVTITAPPLVERDERGRETEPKDEEHEEEHADDEHGDDDRAEPADGAERGAEDGEAARSDRRRRKRALIGAGIVVALVAATAAIVFVAALPGNDGSKPNWASSAIGSAVLGGSGRQEMTAAASLENGEAVAVGLGVANGHLTPAAWTFDRSGWSRLSGTDFGIGRFDGVAVGSDKTIVAVGTEGPTKNPSSSAQNALVWRYALSQWHGRECSTACGDGAAGGGHHGQSMHGVVARRAGGFVAVGYDLNDNDRTKDAAVWVSPDGQRWERIPANQGVFGGGGDQVMQSVTETESGLLVAVGWDRRSGAVWTSRDGRRWARVAVDPFHPLFTSSTVQLTGVVGDGGRLVAVGRELPKRHGRYEAAIWVSTDGSGSSWKRLESDSFSSERGQQLLGVAKIDSHIVGVGYDHDVAGREVAAVWILEEDTVKRVDAETFVGDRDLAMQAVTALPSGRVLAVGDRSSGDVQAPDSEEDAAAWLAEGG